MCQPGAPYERFCGRCARGREVRHTEGNLATTTQPRVAGCQVPAPGAGMRNAESSLETAEPGGGGVGGTWPPARVTASGLPTLGSPWRPPCVYEKDPSRPGPRVTARRSQTGPAAAAPAGVDNDLNTSNLT